MQKLGKMYFDDALTANKRHAECMLAESFVVI